MTPRITTSLAALILAACLIFPTRALAITVGDVEGRSDEELAEDGWQTRQVKSTKGTLKCGLWSIGASLFWQGFGHYCIGDTDSSIKLTIMEGVAAALFTTSMLMGSLSRDDKSLSALWKSFFHFGTTLYIANYFFDVFGTFKGNSFNMADNHLDPNGLSLGVSLRWLPSTDFNLGMQVGITYRNDHFWVKPYVYSPVTDIKSEIAVGIDAGYAPWHAERTHTYIAIALDSKYDGYFGAYHTLKLVPYLEFSLDLGTWFEHLANIRFVNRFGLGVNMYSFNGSDSAMVDNYDTILALETGLSLNIVRDFNFAFTYRYRSDYVVGQLSAPHRIGEGEFPGFGVFSLDLSFHVSQSWLMNINANFGEDIDFWFGVVYRFF